MKYKALVLDLDGTLMTSNNQITAKTRDAIIKIQQSGVKIILASGRPTHGLLKATEILALKKYGGYLLAYNGGRIIDVKNNKIIFDSYLDLRTINDLFDQSRKLNTHLLAYTDNFIITQDYDKYIMIESQINDLPVVKVSDFKTEVKEKSVKCLMTGDDLHLANVEKIMKETYQNRLSISRSMPYFLEFMSEGIAKGNCLKILLDYLKIDKDEVIACGDGYNDINLIEAVGFGVAMANGCQPIKEKAQYITLSNDEEGITHVIEKFFL